MKKYIRWRETAVFALLMAVVVGYVFTRPSGKIERYKACFYDDSTNPGNGSVKVTFFGTSTLLFDDGNTKLLIDGFFSRPSMFTTFFSKLSFNKEAIDEICERFSIDTVEAIFVAHSHYDHALDVAYVTDKYHAQLYGSSSTLNIGKGYGLSDDQMTLFQSGREVQIDSFRVTVIAARHSKPTKFNDDIGIPIDIPLPQPASMKSYTEGGSYDFLITHGKHRIYVKPSANYIAGTLDSIKADLLFLGVGRLGKQPGDTINEFYAETVGKLRPQIVIPIHWDNFFEPFSENLQMMPKLMDNTPKAFDSLIQKTGRDNIKFRILQGGKSIVLH